jgi:lipid II:glycine glycyltransferase (peptidoglycan interpeptide bridge formation enzyme)
MHKRKQIADISIDPNQLREIHRDLPLDLKTRIFLCNKDGNPIAGAVISAIGETAILLLAASSVEGRRVMASYLLQWKIIDWLKIKGVRSYDLGGITPSTPWVNHFKAGLGGAAVSHLGLFEQCTNPASSLFDRSLGIMKNYRNRLGKAVRKLQGFL